MKETGHSLVQTFSVEFLLCATSPGDTAMDTNSFTEKEKAP